MVCPSEAIAAKRVFFVGAARQLQQRRYGRSDPSPAGELDEDLPRLALGRSNLPGHGAIELRVGQRRQGVQRGSGDFRVRLAGGLQQHGGGRGVSEGCQGANGRHADLFGRFLCRFHDGRASRHITAIA